MKPISPASCESGIPVAMKVGVRFEIVESLPDSFGVSVADENTEYFSLVSAVIENFVDEQLTFPVAVSSVDDAISFLQELLDVVE